ncbi:putative Xaa-Pro aminopeptidase, partial [Rhizodiscina lignyota]
MAGVEFIPSQIFLTASSSLDKYPGKQQHAQNVARKLGANNGLLYLPGQGKVFREDSDMEVPFRQRRYFYYLSGVDEPDCHLTYDIRRDVLTLFIPPINPERVIWSGRGSTVDEAYDKYDVDRVQLSDAVSETVAKWTKKNIGTVYILHPTQEAFPGQNKLPRVDFTRLQMAIDHCRVIKDPHEIKLIRKANEISADAHRTILTNVRGLTNEAQVEGIFKDMCISKGAKHQAYAPICGSGENAATLHYVKNDEPLEGRQLMVLDAGAEWELYASDVTRTFPLHGEWSEEAQATYSLVQSMQEACIKKIKPGVRFLDIHALAHQIAVTGLLELGILHGGNAKEILEAGTSLAFFPHGLGHHLGLETHDVSDTPINSVWTYQDPTCEKVRSGLVTELCKAPVDARSGGLEEGMVVTVEPGIYFSRFAIQQFLQSPEHSKYINKEEVEKYYSVGGVRIEDNILVTAGGYENLTTAPKGEEMMRMIR